MADKLSGRTGVLIIGHGRSDISKVIVNASNQRTSTAPTHTNEEPDITSTHYGLRPNVIIIDSLSNLSDSGLIVELKDAGETDIEELCKADHCIQAVKNFREEFFKKEEHRKRSMGRSNAPHYFGGMSISQVKTRGTKNIKKSGRGR